MIPTRFRTHGAWKKAATLQGARRFGGDAMFDVAHAPDGKVMGEWNGSSGIGWVSGHFVGQSKATDDEKRADNWFFIDSDAMKIHTQGRGSRPARSYSFEDANEFRKAIKRLREDGYKFIMDQAPSTSTNPARRLNHLSERVLQTYSGWRRAAIDLGATRFEGNKDIAHAFTEDDAGRSLSVGEWDGETGTVRELDLVPGRDVEPNPAYRGRLSPRVLGLLRDAMIAATPHVDNLVGIITNDPRVKDKAKRLRWDMLWTGQRLARNDAMREVYAEGANDDHIDTAIRHIARELNVPWQGATTGNPVGRDVEPNPAYRGRLSPRVLGLLRDAMIAATPHVDNLVGIITNDPRVKDKAKRMRWDMLWTGQRLTRNDAMREVYAEGANDDHIDTAIRHIARELNVPWQGATTGNPVGRGGHPLYVEFVRLRPGEDPFEMKGTKWQFVTARYPDGRLDIGVYSFAGDLVYSYDSWRRMHNIQGAASEPNIVEDEA